MELCIYIDRKVREDFNSQSKGFGNKKQKINTRYNKWKNEDNIHIRLIDSLL